MEKLKKVIALVTICLACLGLSGCYDAIEIDEEVYALSIGVDKGTNNAIRVTFQYATYKEDSGGGMGGGGEESGEAAGTIVSSVEAASLLEAINIMNASVNRQISLMHTKLLVFSEEFAREGVAKYVEPLTRFREVREHMRIVVCKGKAQDFIKENKAFIGSNPSKALELMFEQSKNSGYFPDVLFGDFYVDLLTPYGQAVAAYGGINDFKIIDEESENAESQLKPEVDIEPGDLPRTGGTKKEIFGLAVFDGDRMVGTLSQNETRFFLIGIGAFQRGFFTFVDENEPELIFVIEVQLGRKPKLNARMENGVPMIGLEIKLDIDIISIQSRRHYERLENIDEFESKMQDYFQQGMKDTIEKTQKEYNSDIFHFGKKIAGSFNTIQQLDDYNWISHYQEADVKVSVSVDARQTGFIFGATPIRATESKKGVEE